jgi:hypothetical protein
VSRRRVTTYHIQAKPGVVSNNGRLVKVDSQNEAHLAEWFEQNGFSGLWQRSNVGAVNGGSRYTNDFELSVSHDGRTRRAIVEAKPYKSALTPSIIRRMQGTASFYKTDLLLLYAQKENAWYRIDAKTSAITDYDIPIPGTVPLNSLPKSLSLTAEKRGNRYYQRQFNPLGWLADLVIGLIQGPKPKRRHRKPPKNKR